MLAELCGIGVVQWVKLVKKAAYFANVLFKTIYFMLPLLKMFWLTISNGEL